MNYTKNYLGKIKFLIDDIEDDKIDDLSRALLSCKKNEKTVFVFGNGGSASIASHLATDLNKIFKIKSRNFNEANHITCFANDFGYENWISETLKIYLKKNDLVILISSKGKSKNILNAAKYCKKKGAQLITLTGFSRKNPLRSFNKKKLDIWVDSNNYNLVENIHQIVLLTAIDKINKSKF